MAFSFQSLTFVLDVKLNNVLVNYTSTNDGQDDIRFTDVELADLGSAYPADHKYAQKGVPIGAPFWRSSEVILGLPWNTSTDIWSFGIRVTSCLFQISHLCRRSVTNF
jgi:serine/threonine protein kinase